MSNELDFYDNFDLINIVLKRISTQTTPLTEEDRRIINHLNECLFQLNLKKSKKEQEERAKNRGWF